MEFLLDNPLATMEGPLFLLFYAVVAASAAAALSVLKSRTDPTGQLPAPSIPPRIDPFEIAYLRGGANELARAVVFSLVQKGHLEIKADGAASEIRRAAVAPANSPPLTDIERSALNWFYTARQPKDLFGAGGLAVDLGFFAEQYRVDLENRQLLVSRQSSAGFGPVKWTIALGLVGLGGYKGAAALANGYSNVGFLILLGILAFAAVFWIGRLRRQTKLGRAYLERLQTAFDNLKYESQSPYIQTNPLVAPPRPAASPTFMGVDPLLLSVGVFGSGILAGTVFDSYNQAFHRAQQQSAGGGASCGSSCGSCSSGGGSGDGGGSGCSSSCGGCGGGCS